MTLLTILIFFNFCVSAFSNSDILTVRDTDVLISNLKFLKITRCILVSETVNHKFGFVLKKLMNESISTSFLSLSSFGRFLRKTRPPDGMIAIVIKVESSNVIKDIFHENFKRLHWFTWFLINEDGLDDGIRIPFNCQFFVMKNLGFGNYKIIENYHLKNSSTFSNNFGHWSITSGLNATSLSFYDRRKNMKKEELIRTDYKFEKAKCDTYILEREAQKIWSELSVILNFTLKVTDEPMGSKTSKTPPDGSTCIFGITQPGFDKDWIFLNEGIKVRIATKLRTSNEVGWRAYVRPFNNEMWTLMGVWVLLSTLTIIIVEGCTKKAVYNYIFTPFFCMCNSDPLSTHPPNESISLTTKLVYLMMLVVPAVIIPAYSAYILATLSIILPVIPFTTLEDFASDGSYKLTSLSNSFISRYIEANENPIIKHIREYLYVESDKTVTDFFELFAQLCKNNRLAGLFVDTKNFRSHFRCKMYVMESEVMTLNCGFLLQKDTPIKKLFNEMFAQYREKGIMYKMQTVGEKTPAFLSNLKGETEALSSLTMFHMAAVFLLIPLGIILSLIVLFVEIACHKKQIQVKGKTSSLELNIDETSLWPERRDH